MTDQMIWLWYQHGRGHPIGVQENNKQRFFCKKFEIDSIDLRIEKDNAKIQAEDGSFPKRTALQILNYGNKDPRKYAYDIINIGEDDPE